jgi:hypothetical protein
MRARKEPAPTDRPSPNHTECAESTSYVGPTATVFPRHDGLGHRRDAAVRLPGGDPMSPGTRYHRPPIGFRASGYRDGYAAALRWILNEHATLINESLRAKLTAIVARSCQ